MDSIKENQPLTDFLLKARGDKRISLVKKVRPILKDDQEMSKPEDLHFWKDDDYTEAGISINHRAKIRAALEDKRVSIDNLMVPKKIAMGKKNATKKLAAKKDTAIKKSAAKKPAAKVVNMAPKVTEVSNAEKEQWDATIAKVVKSDKDVNENLKSQLSEEGIISAKDLDLFTTGTASYTSADSLAQILSSNQPVIRRKRGECPTTSYVALAIS